MSKLWKPRDIMIDIETLATRSDAAIIQIGACTFDEKNKLLVSVNPDFYANVENEYHVDQRTVDWWKEQGEAAVESLKMNVVDNPGCALVELDKWLKSTGFQKSYKFNGRSVWANGVQFDLSILRHAYSVEQGHNDKAPWHYRQEKDTRTLYALFRHRVNIRKVDDKDLVRHRADHDCIRQVRGVKMILDKIK
jgi:exodeoxyribonuclease VIII